MLIETRAKVEQGQNLQSLCVKCLQTISATQQAQSIKSRQGVYEPAEMRRATQDLDLPALELRGARRAAQRRRRNKLGRMQYRREIIVRAPDIPSGLRSIAIDDQTVLDTNWANTTAAKLNR